MPVNLSREAEDVWLDPLVLDTARLLPLLKPYPPKRTEFHPVSQIVNSPANDTLACLVPTSQPVQLKPRNQFGEHAVSMRNMEILQKRVSGRTQ